MRCPHPRRRCSGAQTSVAVLDARHPINSLIRQRLPSSSRQQVPPCCGRSKLLPLRQSPASILATNDGCPFSLSRSSPHRTASRQASLAGGRVLDDDNATQTALIARWRRLRSGCENRGADGLRRGAIRQWKRSYARNLPRCIPYLDIARVERVEHS